jgi:hypothetical protein
MEYNNQKTNINQLTSDSLDVNFEEIPNKKCNTCDSAKNKMKWMILFSFYVFIMAIIGQIQVIKKIMSLF